MSSEDRSLHILVVVLGDLGRSPRMMYHVLSLLDAGHCVSFVGYAGEPLIPPLLHRRYKARLNITRFQSPKLTFLKSYAIPIYFLVRTICLTALLVWALFLKRRTREIDVVLVQNPPAVPLLAVAVLYCRIFDSSLVIDWHNLGFSMIPKTKTLDLFRQITKRYEKALAPAAVGHLTVTKALKDYLVSEMGIKDDNMAILRDCPPSIFRLRTVKEQHMVLRTLSDAVCTACPKDWCSSLNSEKQTLFTEEYDPSRYRPRSGRPALVVSSTSYTRDEDIALLIEAAQILDNQIEKSGSRLKVFCAITGKGPLKSYYEEIISKMSLNNVVIATLWVEPSDYPSFMACADLGVSLHTSTSGRDLPIKILDYFGCEVPVCAYEFPCLHELVQDDVNGRTFVTSPQLADLLWNLLKPLEQNPGAGNHDFGDLKRYSLQVQGRLLWSENWPKNAWPVIEKAANMKFRIE